MIMSMGGASGILFGSLFLSGTLNKQPKEKLLPKDLAQMGKESLDAVKAREARGWAIRRWLAPWSPRLRL